MIGSKPPPFLTTYIRKQKILNWKLYLQGKEEKQDLVELTKVAVPQYDDITSQRRRRKSHVIW